MNSKVSGQIREIGGCIEQVAGPGVCEKVTEGNVRAGASSDLREVALWVKGAVDRVGPVLRALYFW